MIISLRTIAFSLYRVAHTIIRVSGLMGPVRKLAGPMAGRSLYRLSDSGAGLAQIHGHQMQLATEGGYPPLNMAMGRYEPGTTRIFQECLEPGMTVVDIGAHVGYFTLLAAKQVAPAGRVYAFEPERDNHALLLKNIEMNGYENIVATRMALSDRVGDSALYLTGLDSGRHSMFHHGLPERGSAAVETTTLDSFLGSADWPSIDLIKIDVEGAEATVLDGMAQLLERSLGLKMIIEFNPALLQSAGVAPVEFIKRLASRDWTVKLIDEANGRLSQLPDDTAPFVARLLASKDSANLFCAPE